MLVSACSQSERAVAPQTSVTLKNATLDSIGYVIAELETANRFEIRDTIPIANMSGRILAPTASVEITTADIQGYSAGASIRLFVYRVQAGLARYRGMVTYSDIELRAKQSLIAVTPDLLAKLSLSVQRASEPELFERVIAGTKLPALAEAQLKQIKGRVFVSDVQIVRANAGAMSTLSVGNSVGMDLAPSIHVVALGDRAERRGASRSSWHATLQGSNFGFADLAVTQSGVSATLRVDTMTFVVEPIGAGLHAISRIDRTKVPAEHPSDKPMGADSTTTGGHPQEFLTSSTRALPSGGVVSLTGTELLRVP